MQNKKKSSRPTFKTNREQIIVRKNGDNDKNILMTTKSKPAVKKSCTYIFQKKNKTEGQHWWTTYQYHTYRVSCFRRKLAMHVKFWHSNWRQNITLVSTKRFTSERAIKIRVFAWYWVAFYARTPILRATCHVKFVIMVRVIVITLDRTRQCCSNLLVSSRIWSTMS